MNYVWPVLILFSFVSAIITGNMEALSSSVIDGAQSAVELLLRVLSIMCLWGGLMRIAEKAELTSALSSLFSPFVKLIFPRLKKEKHILEAISMNITANVLGLGNAATPLGIEAMKRLQSINESDERASDEMVVFVVINTAAIHIIPTTVASLRGQYGSLSPMEIMPASLLTSVCALTVALIAAKIGNRFGRKKLCYR